MDITLPLDQMTIAEKLRVMESLWADLSRNEQELESPAWHEQVLKERDERVRSGDETFIDWETAKRQLRDRLKLRSSSSPPPARTWLRPPIFTNRESRERAPISFTPCSQTSIRSNYMRGFTGKCSVITGSFPSGFLTPSIIQPRRKSSMSGRSWTVAAILHGSANGCNNSFSACQPFSLCLDKFQRFSISAFQLLICRFLLSAFPISAFDWPLTRSPGIKRGVLRVAGTGISVRTIARLHQQGLTPEEIAISRYNLKLEQVHAALAYYFANRDEIEADIARQEQETSRIEAEVASTPAPG